MARNYFVQVMFAFFVSTLLTHAAARLVKRQITDGMPAAWQYQGCWSDNVNNRTLSLMADAGGHVSNVKCQTLCSRLGYSLAGTEYAGECFCGNRVNGLAQQISDDLCNMACTGDASQVCGGPNAVSLYWDGNGAPFQLPDDGSSASSSTIDPTDSAATSLSEPSSTDSTESPPTLTSPSLPTSDTSPPSSASDPLAISDSSTIVADSTISTANSIPSTKLSASALSSSTATESSTATTPPTSTKPTTTPSPTVVTTNLPHNFSYQGCFVDSTLARILPIQQPDSTSLTVEGCVNTCSSLGYSTAGVELQVQCFCGTEILNGGYRATSPFARLSCKMACSGDATEGCGGRSLMAVYSSGALIA
ncbi:hypothetical protein Q7P35_011410 [Cladosporium inversicolor]